MRYTENTPQQAREGQEVLSPLDAAAKTVAKEIKRLRKRDPRAAIDFYLEKTPAHLRDHPRVTTSLARAYLQMNDFDTAERLLRQTLDINPQDEVAHSMLAQLNMQRGPAHFDTAERLLRQTLDINPQDEVAHSMLAQLNMQRGPAHFDTAERLLRQTLDINPQNEVAHSMLAVLYMKQGDLEAAVRQIATLIRYNVSEPALWILERLASRGSHSADQLLVQALGIAEQHQLLSLETLHKFEQARLQRKGTTKGGRQRYKQDEEDYLLEIIGEYARSKMFTTNLIPRHINYTAKWVGTGQGPD